MLAPVVRGARASTSSCSRELQTKGFSRARVDGEVVAADRARPSSTSSASTHRGGRRPAGAKASAKRRLTDSIETALQLGGGLVDPRLRRPAREDPDRERTFSEHLACLYDDLSFEELEPRSFSFNSPYGACPDCTGLGTRKEVDPELVVPDPELSLDEGAVRRGRAATTSEYFGRLLDRAGRRLGFRTDVPWQQLPAAARKAVLHGVGETQVHVRYRNRYGRERSLLHALRGRDPVPPAAARRGRERHEPGALRGVHAGHPVPHLPRRPAQARVARRHRRRPVDRRGASMSIGECARVPRGLTLPSASSRSPAGCSRRSTPGCGSCSTSVSTTSRSTGRPATLAGGEAQRIRLATQIGSGLVGVLYVLDEP